MKLPRRRFLYLAAGAGALPLLPRITRAQDFPSRPSRWSFRCRPGEPMTWWRVSWPNICATTLGQPVIVENIPGADRGIIKVIQAEPDGHTLGIGGWAPYVLRPLVFSLPFDLLKDLEPVAFVADAPFWIVSKTEIPGEGHERVHRLAQGQPRQGLGRNNGRRRRIASLRPASAEQHRDRPSSSFRIAAGRRRYRIWWQGQIDFMCDFAANSLPQVRAGQLRAYAVMARSRWEAAPEIPTADEAGLPGLYISNWTGLWAPPGTPKAGHR